jgi:hypothetical protein
MKYLILFGAVALLSGCATTGAFSQTGAAMINNHREAGFSTDELVGTKIGKACSENWFGVITLGDSTISTAMEQAGITKVSTVDYDYFKAIFYGRFCAIVKGS